MKRASLALLLLLSSAARQDPAPDVETLLNRAAEGKADAEAELVRRGPAVERAVRQRLSASPRESWVVLDRIVRRIETDERRRRFRSAAAPIALKVEGKPFCDVLPDLDKIVLAPMGPRSPFKDPVTVDLKDVSGLEAFDRVCAAAKVSWYAQWTYGSSQVVPQVLFRAAKESESAGTVRYVKGFRIGVGGVTVQRRRGPDSDEASAWTGGAIQPLPGLGHVHLDELVIEKVVDDRGTILHAAPERKPGRERRPQHLMGAAPPLGGIPFTLSLKPPAREARTFSILGGVAHIRGEVERRHVALEVAESAIGKPVDFEGVTLTLEAFHQRDGKTVIGVVHRGRRRPAETSEDLWAVEGNQLEFAVLRLRDGSTVLPERVQYPWGREGRAEHVYATIGSPAEIRFITYTVWEREKLEFEFRDLPLPASR